MCSERTILPVPERESTKRCRVLNTRSGGDGREGTPAGDVEFFQRDLGPRILLHFLYQTLEEFPEIRFGAYVYLNPGYQQSIVCQSSELLLLEQHWERYQIQQTIMVTKSIEMPCTQKKKGLQQANFRKKMHHVAIECTSSNRKMPHKFHYAKAQYSCVSSR